MESTNRRRRRQKGYPCNALRLLIRLWGIITSIGKNQNESIFDVFSLLCSYHVNFSHENGHIIWECLHSYEFSLFSFYFRLISIGCWWFIRCSTFVIFVACVDIIAVWIVCVYLFSVVVLAFIWGSVLFSLCLFTLSSIFIAMQDEEPHSSMHISFCTAGSVRMRE